MKTSYDSFYSLLFNEVRKAMPVDANRDIRKVYSKLLKMVDAERAKELEKGQDFIDLIDSLGYGKSFTDNQSAISWFVNTFKAYPFIEYDLSVNGLARYTHIGDVHTAISKFIDVFLSYGGNCRDITLSLHNLLDDIDKNFGIFFSYGDNNKIRLSIG